MPVLAVEFPLDLVSAANVRRGAREHMARVKRHREAAFWNLTAASRRTGLVPRLPCTVTITRYGTRKLDRQSNLQMASKALADGIACKPTKTRPAGFLRVDDDDAGLAWVHRQQVVPRKLLPKVPGQCVVRIEIAWGEERQETPP